ncbi:MAG: PAS domain S-box protein, partial [Methanoregula sp.]|nr:PAS domain S-box protein [Methanoregula sp.]
MSSLTPNTMNHKATEEELRESMESFKALAENANDGILIAAAGGAHMYANRRAGEITGYSVAELLKTSIKDLAAPDEVKNLMEKFRKRISGEDIPKQYETLIIRKDGRSVPIEITAAKTIWHGQPAIMVIIRDITERKRVEVALKESETRLHQLVESTTDWVWTINLEGYHTYSSPAIYDLLGYQVSEIVGTYAFPLMHPDDEPLVRDMLKQCIEFKVGWHNVPIRWLHKDGSVRLFESTSSPLVDTHGQITGFSGIDRDITERKRVEDALRESEAKYRLIADNTADSIWIFDMDMRLQYISPSVKNMKGFNVKETLSQSLEEMMTPASLESLMKRFHQEMALEASGTDDPDRTVSFETEEYCKSGATILVENSVTLIRDSQGRPVGMLGVSRDITERKQMEDALRESEKNYRNIFDNAVEGIYQVTPEGRFIRANLAAARVLGYESADELMVSVTDIQSQIYAYPEDRDRAVRIIRETGVLKDFEVQCRHKNGSIVWVSFCAKPVRNAEGAILYHEGTSQDITDRKQVEDALRKERDFANSILGTAQVIILILNTEGHIVYFNPFMEEISGYNLEDVKGKDWFETFLPSHIQESVRSLFQKAIGNIQTRGNVDTIITKDGRERQIEWYDRTLKGADGSIEGLLSIGQDVTDKKKAEEALRESEERYRILTDAAHDVIYTLSPEGMVTFMNSGGSALIGMPPE